MKAIVYENYGSPDELHLSEIEIPTPKENEVLVKVHAASVNSWDYDLLRGVPFVNRMMFGLFKPKVILGCDISGTVEAVGKNVTKYRQGDQVFGDLSEFFSGVGWGGFAEYVCASEEALSPKPSDLSFEEAAAVPQAGVLALQALKQVREVRSGDKILINGASGGVGSFAVQLAKLWGAEVTGVCSTGKMEFVRSLGADHVIDYKEEDFTCNGQAYDRIVDVQAHHGILDYKRALSRNGVYVMIGGASSLVWKLLFLGPWLSILQGKKMGLLMHKANKGLNELAELLTNGKVKVVIDRCYPLREVPEAMRYFAAAKHKGKIIIKMDEA